MRKRRGGGGDFTVEVERRAEEIHMDKEGKGKEKTYPPCGLPLLPYLEADAPSPGVGLVAGR